MSIDLTSQPDSDVYKTLLESTKAIPWRIDWASMTFSYIGPQIETLLGWTPQSWVSVDDWVERMHPDDREYVMNFCVSQSRAGVDTRCGACSAQGWRGRSADRFHVRYQ